MSNKIILAIVTVFFLSFSVVWSQQGLILNPLGNTKDPSTQVTSENDEGLSADQLAVKKVIVDLFDGMRASDGRKVSLLFDANAALSSVYVDQRGQTQYKTDNSKAFVEAIGKPKADLWDERIWDYDIKVDGPLAKAWTPYSFYLNKNLSHCGVNDFELIKKSGQWKISRIIDTRRKTNCTTDPVSEINTLMDAWHKAAAIADEDVFFGSMTADAIYVGTDASERWQRDEMRKWAQPYFNRSSAWDFRAKSRNVTMSDDGEMAWMDELLDTWMGDCRSSAVLVKEDDNWKIKHYHLAIAVPNDAVDGYLQVIGKQRR